MEKQTETKTEKLEREYVIPLREKCRTVPRYKKSNKAVRTIKEFLARHMKVYDRDLKKIKIDKYLNEFVWFRGIKKPPAKIKVKAIKEGNIIKVELVDLPEKLKFKKLREDKIEIKAKETAKKKEKLVQKEPEEKPKEESEKEKKEEKEKIESVREATKEMEKAAAKRLKHERGGKTKQPKRQQRVALQK